jgi:hypothetical protein
VGIDVFRWEEAPAGVVQRYRDDHCGRGIDSDLRVIGVLF